MENIKTKLISIIFFLLVIIVILGIYIVTIEQSLNESRDLVSKSQQQTLETFGELLTTQEELLTTQEQAKELGYELIECKQNKD